MCVYVRLLPTATQSKQQGNRRRRGLPAVSWPLRWAARAHRSAPCARAVPGPRRRLGAPLGRGLKSTGIGKQQHQEQSTAPPPLMRSTAGTSGRRVAVNRRSRRWLSALPSFPLSPHSLAITPHHTAWRPSTPLRPPGRRRLPRPGPSPARRKTTPTRCPRSSRTTCLTSARARRCGGPAGDELGRTGGKLSHRGAPAGSRRPPATQPAAHGGHGSAAPAPGSRARRQSAQGSWGTRAPSCQPPSP